MNIGFRKWGWLVTLRVTRYGEIHGVHSYLPDGKHFFMADFDGSTFEEVRSACVRLMQENLWGPVTIVQSSPGNHYHAYCLRRLTWAKLVYCWLSTPEVDQQWVKLSVQRGYGTLRYSPRGEWGMRAIERLGPQSIYFKSDVAVDEIKGFSTLAQRVK